MFSWIPENVCFWVLNVCHALDSLEADIKIKFECKRFLGINTYERLGESKIGQGEKVKTAIYVWQSLSQACRQVWNRYFPLSSPVVGQSGWGFLPHLAQYTDVSFSMKSVPQGQVAPNGWRDPEGTNSWRLFADHLDNKSCLEGDWPVYQHIQPYS